MDIFWLIPVGIVAAIIIGILCFHVLRQPESPSEPRVLVDKPATEPVIDESALSKDWEKRPCGSFMDWLTNRS